MSQDYTVAKELASLKEIKQSAEQRISELSLNALNYVNDHRLHKVDAGGEGGILPVASAENEGSVLTSTKKYVKGAVIVPEQTVTLDGDNEAELFNTNKNLFTIGTVCFAVVDDIEYQGTVYEHPSGNNTITVNDGGMEFWIDGDRFWYYHDNLQEGDESTVAVYVAEPEYSWQPDPYAGYDVIIKTSKQSISLITANDLELVAGSYETASKLALDGKPIKCIVYYCNVYDGGVDYWEYPINRVYCGPGYNNVLDIHILHDNPKVNVKDADGNTMEIFGASAHYGRITLTESGLSYTLY